MTNRLRPRRSPSCRRSAGALLGMVALIVTACSDEAAAPVGTDTAATIITSTPTTAPDADVSTTVDPPASTTVVPPPVVADPCADQPDTAASTADSPARSCLLPWPNDALTIDDPSTPTGRRLALPSAAMPANADGVRIDVSDQNRADGFSPASVILVDLPGVDPAASGLADSTDVGSSLRADAPITITDTSTGERVPYFAELDAQAPSDAEQLLMVHPAVLLTEGRTYEVSIGALVGRTGEPLVAPVPQWTFTVASAASLSGRLLSIREQAYADLGAAAPVVRVESFTDANGVRTIDGVVEVPNFLSGDGAPGSTLLLGPDGLPQRNTEQPGFPARFHCVVPTAPVAPVPMIVYGHGLLGSRFEAGALSFAASLGLAGACGTDWIGMSSDDIGNVAAILGDLSRFNQQADRMVQGQLNMQFLGRALNHPDALAAQPAFRTAADTPIIATGATQFVGNSQGGILGGAASAVSTEWQRVVLGVPGVNYSLLLHRSSNWPQFQAVFDQAYTDPVERATALQLIQLLWDRGENAGYVQHLTADTYPGIEPKQVLLVQAFGDHQVANVSTEVLARTIGARAHRPALGNGRSPAREPLWGIDALEYGPLEGAALIVWDFGTPAPPVVNLPPNSTEHGIDPHGAASSEPRVLQQALTFLLSGTLDDVCGAEPCVSDVLAG